MKTRKILPTLGALAASAVLMSACSGGMDEGSSPEQGDDQPAAEQDSASDGGGMGEDMDDMDMDPAANLVGPGCADYAEMVPDGDGSVDGMAQDPLSVAASNNPMLTTLTSAISGELNPDVDLVDTLDGDEFTVFAPVDDAFGAIPEDDLNALASDADSLSTVLTYHVVPGQIAPDEIAGTHTTVQGEDVEVTGSGDDLMVDGAAVVCGGVKTQNATVYLVDTVLMPPSMADAS
ncbi:fasciclin domain-containing protein [Brachybacterium alimentarium]|uniref:fasciclin domain-containing protein n=1 Tax=Brachybacterium alimentarium TaxID=47845 RepID=UPI000BB76A56|nr:fasciclin domain-containing protein [Brachybacterium alimentarium]PCC31043.1 fasciclin [Brachybacterium alimentarium]RCS67845.1 fasciclin domain-containing protein [Brachybacterium alimentarium]RCS77322.1 fasciclin domain-containing protein [Brachybacterium alimentarium]RCS78030.1 fasciclin domain-containing protein [Brachybacterium alimentarium]RCS86252.1 fasciclin domain-containing protein [Brachybacterium alimentarium]